MEYVLGLTWRQIDCLWERYWERKMWELEINILTNPMAGDGGESDVPTIDATTDEGLSALVGMGIPVKRI
jgi:hypothetical protein